MFFYSPTALPLRPFCTSSLLSLQQYWAKGTNCESSHYVISPVFFIFSLTAATPPVLLQLGA